MWSYSKPIVPPPVEVALRVLEIQGTGKSCLPSPDICRAKDIVSAYLAQCFEEEEETHPNE